MYGFTKLTTMFGLPTNEILLHGMNIIIYLSTYLSIYLLGLIYDTIIYSLVSLLLLLLLLYILAYRAMIPRKRKIDLHGTLYLTSNFICFYANVFGSKTKVIIVQPIYHKASICILMNILY